VKGEESVSVVMLRVNVKERKLCFNQNYVDEEGRKVCVIATKIVVEGER